MKEQIKNILISHLKDADHDTIAEYLESLFKDEILNEEELSEIISGFSPENDDIILSCSRALIDNFSQKTIAPVVETCGLKCEELFRLSVENEKNKVIKKETNLNLDELDEVTKRVLKESGVKSLQDEQSRQSEIDQINLQCAMNQLNFSSNPAEMKILDEDGDFVSLIHQNHDSVIEDFIEKSSYRPEVRKDVSSALEELNSKCFNTKSTKYEGKRFTLIETPNDSSKETAQKAVSFLQREGNLGRSFTKCLTQDLNKYEEPSTDGGKQVDKIKKKNRQLKSVGVKAEQKTAIIEEGKKEKSKQFGLNQNKIDELDAFF